jgi:hypothetical protein
LKFHNPQQTFHFKMERLLRVALRVPVVLCCFAACGSGDLIGKVFQRMGSEPGQLVTHYPQVAFIETGDKLAVVKRPGYKPRVALFALLKMFAPGYNPSDLFYRKGLREFLAACGVHQPSSSTVAQDTVLDEGAGGVRQPLTGTTTIQRGWTNFSTLPI